MVVNGILLVPSSGCREAAEKLGADKSAIFWKCLFSDEDASLVNSDKIFNQALLF